MVLKNYFKEEDTVFFEFLYFAMFCPSGRTKGWIFIPHTPDFEAIFIEMAFYFP